MAGESQYLPAGCIETRVRRACGHSFSALRGVDGTAKVCLQTAQLDRGRGLYDGRLARSMEPCVGSSNQVRQEQEVEEDGESTTQESRYRQILLLGDVTPS